MIFTPIIVYVLMAISAPGSGPVAVYVQKSDCEAAVQQALNTSGKTALCVGVQYIYPQTIPAGNTRP
jgi:hypothetical protein